MINMLFVCCLVVFTKGEEKRILLEGNALEQLHEVVKQMEVLQAKVAALEQSTKQSGTYIRWGRTTCPSDNQLVYQGYAGGSDYRSPGGAANWLCLTDHPEWGYYEEGVASGAQVLGAEYEFSDYHYNGGSNYLKQNLNDEDAPCSVCLPPRSNVLMIPGKLTCPSGWTKEYSGYLIAGAAAHSSATEFICLDTDAEMLAGGVANTDGRVIYLA